MALQASSACRSSSREVLVTDYDGDLGVSFRYPASWTIREARQQGALYRYLLPPGEKGQAPPSFSVVLLGTKEPVEVSAERTLAGQKLGASRDESRGGGGGKSWSITSADGKTSGRLILLARDQGSVGLYAQGPPAKLAEYGNAIDEIWASFAVERPQSYPVRSFRGFEATIGVPASWKETRQFSGRGTTVVQYASPPLGMDRKLTIHAALSVTLEPAPAGGVGSYYEATRRKLGDNYVIASHEPFQGGFVDVMRTETPIAVSYIKRYYFADTRQACSLSFEAREDVFNRASRWADTIAATFRLGTAARAETAR